MAARDNPRPARWSIAPVIWSIPIVGMASLIIGKMAGVGFVMAIPAAIVIACIVGVYRWTSR